jgi:hypothetical protein
MIKIYFNFFLVPSLAKLIQLWIKLKLKTVPSSTWSIATTVYFWGKINPKDVQRDTATRGARFI